MWNDFFALLPEDLYFHTIVFSLTPHKFQLIYIENPWYAESLHPLPQKDYPLIMPYDPQSSGVLGIKEVFKEQLSIKSMELLFLSQPQHKFSCLKLYQKNNIKQQFILHK